MQRINLALYCLTFDILIFSKSFFARVQKVPRGERREPEPAAAQAEDARAEAHPRGRGERPRAERSWF